MTFIFPLFGYLCGSLPFSVWITRLVKGVDVREVGSGHAGATNTVRQAGFGWGALVLFLDIGKGFLPVFLALRSGAPPFVVVLTAVLVVLGHCFPVFAQFRGGMGLAAAGGCLLALDPLAALIPLALLILLVLTIRHAARASVLSGIFAAPVLWLFHIRGLPFWAAAGVGAVVALRFLINWNRQYRELWLDRETKKDE